MGTWLTVAELQERYGASAVDDRADRDRDGSADSGVLDAAIADAEGRVKSELLTRFAPADLPTTTATASAPLKRVCARLSWYYLWSSATVIPPPVIVERDEAVAELRSLVRGSAALLLSGEPAVDNSRPQILRTSAATTTTDPITFSRLANWGR